MGSPRCHAALLPAALCLALAACAAGPEYKPPVAAAPDSWQSVWPAGGLQADIGGWWATFDDPNLSRLVDAAQKDSPSLAQAWAAIGKARATLTTDRAAGLPSVSAGSSFERARTQGGSSNAYSVANTRSVDVAPSWDIDLFGKSRRNVAAARARIAEREADWHNTRIALAAEVADDYVQYRGCRQLVDAYERSARSAAETARVTAIAVKAGLSPASDGDLANASEGSSRSSLHAQQLQCVLLVKSLVALTGLAEPTLRALLDAPGLPALPRPASLVVPSVPADALRGRPDLAALEREVAATSEEIGAAVADRYPTLSLTGLITLAASAGATATTWSFGPGLSATLFDAGKGRAAVDSARASYDSAVASYQDGVRTAVKDVERALAELDSAAHREEDARMAADGYQRSLRATEVLWRAGNTDLLSLEETRRSAISAEVDLISLRQARVQYWIALHKALGGGWRADLPAQRPQVVVASPAPTSE